jgi:hypothetical protein
MCSIGESYGLLQLGTELSQKRNRSAPLTRISSYTSQCDIWSCNLGQGHTLWSVNVPSERCNLSLSQQFGKQAVKNNTK